MDYLKQSVDLSRESFEAGEFPAGAVLVTKSGAAKERRLNQVMTIGLAVANRLRYNIL